jgi:uncharacterized protein (TIGR00299 family) protein
MLLGALIDAGAPEEKVRSALDALPVTGWKLELSTVWRGGLRATRALVETLDDTGSRDFDDISKMLASAALTDAIADRCQQVLAALAQAEGRVHGIDPLEVHFHELGSLDTIVDVVGCCAAFEHFAPEQVTTSPIATGTGSVETAHGPLPLPAPAVVELLQARGAVLYGRGDRELLTPTGAALLSVFTTSFGALPAMQIEASGYGAGGWELEHPNVLRVLVGQPADQAPLRRTAVLIEANVDDMNPELVPPLIDSLLEAGAQDAWVSPAVMKRGRPALTLSVLASPSTADDLAAIIYREATTLGLRFTTVTKDELERRELRVFVQDHPVRVKLGLREGKVVNAAPEYADALAAARATGLPLKLVYARTLREVDTIHDEA